MKPLHTWLSAPGFLGTGAARGSDLLVVGLLALVLLVVLGLLAVRKGHLRRHALCMGSATVLLVAVVVLFTSWTRAGGPRGGRPVGGDLMGLHLALALLGVGLLPFTVGLGFPSLAYREGRSAGAAWPRRHRRLGLITAALLSATAATGLLVYAWRYLRA